MDDLDVTQAARSIGDWLGHGERRYWERLSPGPRQATWLAGRILMKTLVCDQLQRRLPGGCGAASHALHDIQVHSLDRWGRKSSPQVIWGGKVLDWSLSVAHTDRGVLASLVTHPHRLVGVDLADPAHMARGTSRWWLTADEQSQWPIDCPETRARLWAFKEALYKACSRGERFAPQRIGVRRDSNGRLDCRYAGRAVRLLDLQAFTVDHQIAALAVVDRRAAADSGCEPTGWLEPARYGGAHQRPRSGGVRIHGRAVSGRETLGFQAVREHHD